MNTTAEFGIQSCRTWQFFYDLLRTLTRCAVCQWCGVVEAASVAHNGAGSDECVMDVARRSGG